ncbi:hypothetical protein ES705_41068 [subsurface metagenome]|nr:hypothetical protein [Clostridia bacterium]
MFNYEPDREEVELWWAELDYVEQLDLIEKVYPDCGLDTVEGWQYLDWPLKLELYNEEQ